jgi:hypothetical protein
VVLHGNIREGSLFRENVASAVGLRGREVAQLIKRTTATGENRYDVRTRIAGRVVTRTFKRRKDADVYANTTEADKLRGVVVDPRRARVTLKEYAGQWLVHRPDLAVRTRELYGWLLDKHILPTFGDIALADLSPSVVRAWHAALAVDRPTTAAKAYRLLSSILRTALTDEVITRNPCQVKGAAVERAPERPVVSTAEVEALAEAMPEHLRVAVLLAAWCQLRRGELLGLRRRDIDILRGADDGGQDGGEGTEDGRGSPDGCDPGEHTPGARGPPRSPRRFGA